MSQASFVGSLRRLITFCLAILFMAPAIPASAQAITCDDVAPPTGADASNPASPEAVEVVPFPEDGGTLEVFAAASLVDAFAVEEARRPSIVAETLATLADARFMHYLLTIDGVPAAAARRATFDRLSYLSSIGTAPWARGRGVGKLITATATLDGLDAGAEWTHLGVFADNRPAIGLYRSLGYDLSGEPGPDMILTGS